MRTAVTASLIAAAAALLIFLICGSVVRAIIAPTPSTRSSTNAGGYTLDTIQHDGHLFIRASGGGLLHHPDCPCLANTKKN